MIATRVYAEGVVEKNNNNENDNHKNQYIVGKSDKNNLEKNLSIGKSDKNNLEKNLSDNISFLEFFAQLKEEKKEWKMRKYHVDLFLKCPSEGDYVNLPDSGGRTALMIACHCHPDAVDVLLKKPQIDVNRRRNEGFTALMVACKYNPEAAKKLLALPHTDVNVKSCKGSTALMVACRYNPQLVEFFLKRPSNDVDVNLQGSDGKTALMFACWEHSLAVKALLKHESTNVNQQDLTGTTALMLACSREDAKCLELLLEHPKVDVNIRDKINSTALAIAYAEKQQLAAVKLLDVPEINVEDPAETLFTPIFERFLKDKEEEISIKHQAMYKYCCNRGKNNKLNLERAPKLRYFLQKMEKGVFEITLICISILKDDQSNFWKVCQNKSIPIDCRISIVAMAYGSHATIKAKGFNQAEVEGYLARILFSASIKK